jgi:hypothetical protein
MQFAAWPQIRFCENAHRLLSELFGLHIAL